jgi:hypothetical protein
MAATGYQLLRGWSLVAAFSCYTEFRITMITPHDEQVLQRLLGCQVIPADVLAEVELRTAMYHAEKSGPLGPMALIDAIRFCGRAPATVKKEPKKVEWRRFPQDGSVKVEAMFFGAWKPGAFLGFVEAGTLAIRLEDDAVIRECRPDMVRLPEGETERLEFNENAGHTSKPAPLTAVQELASQPSEPEVIVEDAAGQREAAPGAALTDTVSGDKPAETDRKKHKGAKNTITRLLKQIEQQSEDLDKVLAEPIPSLLDHRDEAELITEPPKTMAEIAVDSPVWVEMGDDIFDGSYCGPADDQNGVRCVTVRLQGDSEPKIVPAECVKNAA